MAELNSQFDDKAHTRQELIECKDLHEQDTETVVRSRPDERPLGPCETAPQDVVGITAFLLIATAMVQWL